ncbi:MAG: hypothetical protein FJ102_13315 [Deltaproteobacteria bacterium]|nr:hypothetical protein [Deltaproteobacteria bacterium]
MRPAILVLLSGCVWVTDAEVQARLGGDDSLAPGESGVSDTGLDDTGRGDTGGGETGDTGDTADTGIGCDVDRDGHDDVACGGDDCDDGNANRHPGADETCNEADDDCDGTTDEDAVDDQTYYQDGDGDGFGTDGATLEACVLPDGYAEYGGDCDDGDASFHPGAEESCDDPVDYNCDGSSGSDDRDSDGVIACEDCDDGDPAVFPGAEELCNDVDDDCNGDIDAGATDADTWYADGDSDGYGGDLATLDCDRPAGHVETGGDCNDADDDCNGTIDDDATDASTWYADTDGDSYGTAASTTRSCDQPTGHVANDDDCDDDDDAINPAGSEACDGIDTDCDGYVDGPLAVPSAMASIQAAVDAASDGDLICIAAGTYAETLDLGDLAITLQGAGSGSTVVQADGVDRALSWNDTAGRADLVLRGIDFTGGEAAFGGGLYLDGDSVVLDDVAVYGNTCSSATDCVGTGIYLLADAEFTSVSVRDNVAEPAGIATAYIYGAGVYAYDVDLVWTDVSVTGNISEVGSVTSYGYAFGTGLSLSAVDLDAVNLELSDNAAIRTGATLYAAAAQGAALSADGGRISITGGTITDNVVDYSAATDTGAAAGLLVNNSTLDLVQAVLRDNGIDAGTSEGAALFASGASDVTLTNVILSHNTAAATGIAYGAVAAYGTTTMELVNTVAFRNGSSGTTYSYGGAFYIASGTSLSLMNSIVAENTCVLGLGSTCGAAVYAAGSSATVTVDYSDFYGNTPDSFVGVGDPTSSGGNIDDDPLFTYTAAKLASSWDFTLSATSPCIDAGNPGAAYNDTDSTRNDMGGFGGPEGSGW